MEIKFAQKYVKYLGHIVRQILRTPEEVKVQTIKDYPPPKTKTEVRAFLGQELLCNKPTLHALDFNKQFIVQTDASDYGMGIILSQLDEKQTEHLVSYLSEQCSVRERK
ncbi:retrovirus-related Pol polyprotein from transposon 17.6 [Caerostris extrusa]|uniref:Retrovirus-related Pol polyprotein from transposon 17.6 n=1 Tax=Caerostris extrusa TaxID=172846 RepID=A0AAV4S7U9_CAEEX|nr:retrovirus-related Pol polyprotein from transposon 17.6 [Caerostris extrusa]